MRIIPASVFGLVISLSVSSAASAQYTYASLERLGLQRNWSTMADASPTGSGIAGVIVSVNHDERQTVDLHELQYDGGFRRFSPLDLGPNGLPIGPEEALRLAEVEELRKKSLNRNPVLTTKSVHPVDLFVSTNSGVLQSIDAETGRTNWSISIGSERFRFVVGFIFGIGLIAIIANILE